MATKEWTAAFCFVLLTAANVAGTDPQSVGLLGRPANVVIHGAKTFPPEKIREALFNELDVVASSDEESSLNELIAVVTQKTVAGYRDAGFIDVQVRTAPADGKLIVTINEGDRYTSGNIEVSGNSRIDAEEIKARFMAPETTWLSTHTLWRPNKAASFGPEANARLAGKAQTLINDQGCYRVKLRATLEPDPKTRQATLHIKIDEEGEQSTLGDVEMAGIHRNSRDALLAYLQLDAATPLTRMRREEVERRLLASGRFVAVRWELSEPDQRGASWRPRLVLDEYDAAPPINQPLSREEAALLKVAEWFRQLDESDEEIVFEGTSEDQVLVLAPRRGFIVAFKASDDDATPPGFDYALVMDESRVGVYSRGQQRKLVAQPPPSPFTGEVVLTVVGGPPGWKADGTIKLGGGLSTAAHKGDRRHVEVHFKLTSVEALSLLHKHKARCDWEGDVLSLEWDKSRLRANAVTGRLVEYVQKIESPDDRDDAELRAQPSAQPGEFDRRLREIETAAADWPNMADPRRPLSCLGEFVCGELQQLNVRIERRIDDLRSDFLDEQKDPEDTELATKIKRDVELRMREKCRNEQRGYAALGKAISLGALEPFDRLIGQILPPRQEEGSFSIPLPQFYIHASSPNEFRSLVREMAPLLGVRIGNFLFPADGWTNAVWRLALFAMAKKEISFPIRTRYAIANDRGPLFSLAAAEIFRMAGNDLESRMCALHRPRRPAFSKEYDELVAGEGFVSEVLLKTAAAMRQLNAAEVVALVQLLIELEMLDETQAVPVELALLRAHAADSAKQAVSDACDAMWRAGLSKWIERRLDELRGRPIKGLPERQPDT